MKPSKREQQAKKMSLIKQVALCILFAVVWKTFSKKLIQLPKVCSGKQEAKSVYKRHFPVY